MHVKLKSFFQWSMFVFNINVIYFILLKKKVKHVLIFSSEVCFLYFFTHLSDSCLYWICTLWTKFSAWSCVGMSCMIFKGWRDLIQCFALSLTVLWFRLKVDSYSLSCLQLISKLDNFWSILLISLMLDDLHKSMHVTSHLHKLWSSFLLILVFACCILVWSPVSTACCATSTKPLESVWCMGLNKQRAKLTNGQKWWINVETAQKLRNIWTFIGYYRYLQICTANYPLAWFQL